MYLSNSELKQITLLKKKTPQERFILMTQLISGQIEAMKAGIKYNNPSLNKKELEKCLKKRWIKIYSSKL
ncbi:MAG: hypothetical protein V1674_01490 [Candidatus Omnitrophota bacterium]